MFKLEVKPDKIMLTSSLKIFVFVVTTKIFKLEV